MGKNRTRLFASIGYVKKVMVIQVKSPVPRTRNEPGGRGGGSSDVIGVPTSDSVWCEEREGEGEGRARSSSGFADRSVT